MSRDFLLNLTEICSIYNSVIKFERREQQQKIRTWQDSNLQSSDSKSDALSITLQVQLLLLTKYKQVILECLFSPLLLSSLIDFFFALRLYFSQGFD